MIRSSLLFWRLFGRFYFPNLLPLSRENEKSHSQPKRHPIFNSEIKSTFLLIKYIKYQNTWRVEVSTPAESSAPPTRYGKLRKRQISREDQGSSQWCNLSLKPFILFVLIHSPISFRHTFQLEHTQTVQRVPSRPSSDTPTKFNCSTYWYNGRERMPIDKRRANYKNVFIHFTTRAFQTVIIEQRNMPWRRNNKTLKYVFLFILM